MDNDKSTSQPIDEEEKLEDQPGEATQEEVSSEVVEEVEDQVEETEPEETVEEETQEESPPPSRRENLRIQQILEKTKQQLQPQQPPQQDTPTALDYRDTINADDEVYKTLETDRQNYGQTQYQQGQNQGLKQAETIQFHTRLEIDAPRVASKYSQLDKDSKDFNPALANAVNEMYLSTAGFDAKTNSVQNANVRYADYIDGIFEMANEIAGAKVQKSAKNIAKQAATTSIRPDGSKAKRMNLDQAPQSMTDEELAAVIAQAIPPNK